ncbi:hypothetical protein SAMN05421776_12155 [Nocardia farcinica]|uniref:Uncharacterized protein n=1 Tax=Nocardia farcinica TaxID=37329 RepID=A0A0H5P8Q1_NOCFR|nr:hypothetical protein [Nocardia farcinica]SLG32764.1 Uncharacterised protein [Mycobacteroides abscessus subsp. abscessus]AXK88548.1 hypothetical protein DXT66_25655 [Nocardia farcinica]PFW98850.1 hypothetical protein CJ469_05811 [Nocardia farcinica]PFX04456.1 hypothetical protein CJ468_05432 [Nocardia farcinica]CRY84215.1 Uncharacterised protein [Nocardia farcinica]
MTPAYTLTEADDEQWIVTGELAEQVRARLGVGRHTQVEFRNEWRTERCNGGGCCNHMSRVFIVEAGEIVKLFPDVGYDEPDVPLDQVLLWLDEPRLLEARRAAEAKHAAQQAQAAAAFDRAVVGSINAAIATVEANSYVSDEDWHDQVMDQLGVGGTRYTERGIGE